MSSDERQLLSPETMEGKHDAPLNGGRSLKAPRPLILDFLLHFSTLGVYTCFWLVGRVREIRELRNIQSTPWLWFFVPYLAVVQLFALPRLVGWVQDAEASYGLPKWKSTGYLWMMAVLVVTLVFNVQRSIALPAWTALLAMAVWAALFTVFEARLNTIKEAATGYHYRRRRYGYSALEWLLVIPLLPVVGWMYFNATWTSIWIKDIDPLVAGSVYEDPEGRFGFPVVADGWVRVEPGTFTDDESLVEVRGPFENTYLIVYQYHDQTLNELAYHRKLELEKALVGARCNERRRFIQESLSVASHLICRGRSFGLPTLWASAIIETDNGLYELMGYLALPPRSFNELEPILLRMTAGFEPL